MPSYEYIGVRAIMAGLSQFRSDINAYNAIVRTAGSATDAFAKQANDGSKVTQASLAAQAKAAADSYGTIIGQSELAVEAAQVYANSVAKAEGERLAAVEAAAAAAITAREKEAASYIAASESQVSIMKEVEAAALREAEVVIAAKASELAAAETTARSLRAIVAAPITSGQLGAGVAANGQALTAADVTAANAALAQQRAEYATLISEQAAYVDATRVAAAEATTALDTEIAAQAELTAATRVATVEIVKDQVEQSAAVVEATRVQTVAAEENLARQTQIAAAQRYLAANAAEAGVIGATGIPLGVGIGAVLGVGAVLAATTKVASSYNDALKQAQVQAGATDEQIQRLDKTIQGISTTSRTGAIEIASMAKSMAASGVSADQLSAGALKAAVDLKNASAGFLSSAQAADFMSNVLSQFQVNASQANSVADVLVAVSAKSRANLDDLAVALRNSGQVAHAYGLSIAETTALLGLFADAGLKGAAGGTALVQMFRQLDNATAPSRAAINEYGLGLKDVDGNLRPLASVMKSFQDVLDGTAVGTEKLTVAQRNSILESVGNTRAYRAFLAIAEQGPEVFKAYVDSVTATGTATDKAGKAADTSAGSFDILKTNLGLVGIAAGNTTKGPLKGLLDTLNEMAKASAKLFTDPSAIANIKAAQAAGNAARAALPRPSLTAQPEEWEAYRKEGSAAYDAAYNLQRLKDTTTDVKVTTDANTQATIAAAEADDVAAAAVQKRTTAAQEFIKVMKERGPGGDTLESFLSSYDTAGEIPKLPKPGLPAGLTASDISALPPSVQQAIQLMQNSNTAFANACEKFVDDLEGIQDRTGRASAASAADMFKAQGLLRTDLNNIEAGARVYFSGGPGGAGHVGFSLGGDKFISPTSTGRIIIETIQNWAKANPSEKFIGFVNGQGQQGPPNASFGTGINATAGIEDQAKAYTKAQEAAKQLASEIQHVDDLGSKYDIDATKLATDYVTAYGNITAASAKATADNRIQADKRSQDIADSYNRQVAQARAAFAQNTADSKLAYDQQRADALLAFQQQESDRLANFKQQQADTIAQRAFDAQIKQEEDAFNKAESQRQLDLTNQQDTQKVAVAYAQKTADIQEKLNDKLALAKNVRQRQLLQVQAKLQQDALDAQHKDDLTNLATQVSDRQASFDLQKQITAETDAFQAQEQAKSLAFQDKQAQASFDRQTVQAQQAFDRQQAAAQQAYDRQQAKAAETLQRQLDNYKTDELASQAKNTQEFLDRQIAIDANDKLEKAKLQTKLDEESAILVDHLANDFAAIKIHDDQLIVEERRVQAALNAAIASAQGAAAATATQGATATGAPTDTNRPPGPTVSSVPTGTIRDFDTGGVAGFGPFGSHIPALLQPDETVLKPTQLMSLINNVSNATTRNIMQNFSYQVNASYTNKQSPASIKLDLQAMVAASR